MSLKRLNWREESWAFSSLRRRLTTGGAEKGEGASLSLPLLKFPLNLGG